MADKIKSVHGSEPRRDGEYPIAMVAGQHFDHVERVIVAIEYEEQNFGTYGIGWYVGRCANGNEIARMNAVHVETVIKETVA